MPLRIWRAVFCLFLSKYHVSNFGTCVCRRKANSLRLFFSLLPLLCVSPILYPLSLNWSTDFSLLPLYACLNSISLRGNSTFARWWQNESSRSYIAPICRLHWCFNWISGFSVSNIASVCVRTRSHFKMCAFRQVVDVSLFFDGGVSVTGDKGIHLWHILAKTFLNEQNEQNECTAQRAHKSVNVFSFTLY